MLTDDGFSQATFAPHKDQCSQERSQWQQYAEKPLRFAADVGTCALGAAPPTEQTTLANARPASCTACGHGMLMLSTPRTLEQGHE